MRKKRTHKHPTSERKEPSKDTLQDTVNIADIAVRDDWQVRNEINRTTVNNYKNIYKNGGTLPPIQLALVAGALRLVDGWHRLEALRLLGQKVADATITEMTSTDARWAAVSANLSHGLPLKPKEVRNVFNAYITARRHYKANGRIKSYREMEADLNGVVSHRSLNRWMEKDHPKIAKEMSNRHGGDDKDHYHDGGPPKPDQITPLQAAEERLAQALAEARAMSPEERRELLTHARRLLGRLEAIPQWTPDEVSIGLHKQPENDDF